MLSWPGGGAQKRQNMRELRCSHTLISVHHPFLHQQRFKYLFCTVLCPFPTCLTPLISPGSYYRGDLSLCTADHSPFPDIPSLFLFWRVPLNPLWGSFSLTCWWSVGLVIGLSHLSILPGPFQTPLAWWSPVDHSFQICISHPVSVCWMNREQLTCHLSQTGLISSTQMLLQMLRSQTQETFSFTLLNNFIKHLFKWRV